jgi:hypothetical protein
VKKCRENTDVVLVYGNTNNETIERLESQGVVLFPMQQNRRDFVHVLRFLFIYEYQDTIGQIYRYGGHNRCKRCIFSNWSVCLRWLLFMTMARPYCRFWRTKIQRWTLGDDNLKCKHMNLMSMNNLKTTLSIMLEHLAGSSEYVKDMVFNIFTNAINRPISICDQAVFNVLLGTQPFKGVTYTSKNWSVKRRYSCWPF